MLTMKEIHEDFRVHAKLPDVVPVTVQSRGGGEEQTALHWMVTLGDDNAIKMLIDAGAEVDAVDASGNTPLHESVSARQLSAVALFAIDVAAQAPIASAMA